MIRHTRASLATSVLLMCAHAYAHDAHRSFLSGAPGDPLRTARTVEVIASEGEGRMRFEPAVVAATKGEQIHFVIRNSGALAHEFVLGSVAENRSHTKMMAAMPDMNRDDPNAITIAPGRSVALLWRFSRGGQVEFACLIPDHYEAGMHGAVTVK